MSATNSSFSPVGLDELLVLQRQPDCDFLGDASAARSLRPRGFARAREDAAEAGGHEQVRSALPTAGHHIRTRAVRSRSVRTNSTMGAVSRAAVRAAKRGLPRTSTEL